MPWAFRWVTTISTARFSRSTNVSRLHLKKPVLRATWVTRFWAATSASNSTRTMASVPTFVGKKRLCSNPLKAKRASRASSLHSRPALACMGSPRRSITPKPLRLCRGSSATAVRLILNVASRTTVAPRSFRCRVMWSVQATTKSRLARLSPNCLSSQVACVRAASSKR